jgi:outer membrane biosynthesis protein TonB
MDRTEAAGLGVATAGHLALLAALSLGFAATRLPPPRSEPIEVSIVDEVAPQSTAPSPAAEAPAARLAEVEGPPEPAPAPAPPVPKPEAQPAPPPPPLPQPRVAPPPPVPAPAPRPAPRRPAPPPAATAPAPPKAAARPAPAKAPSPAPAKPSAPKAAAPPTARPAAARPTGRLSGLLAGLAERETQSRSTAPTAAAAGPAVRASLGAEVRRQLKPHWKAPTGADAELLRTELSISLARDGSVTRVDVLRTTGQTPSNKPQVKLHQEQAVRAVRLASPFRLPAEFYESWKLLSPIGFDRRLSQ